LSEFCPDPDPGLVAGATPRREEIHTLAAGTALSRLHFKGGPYPMQWHQFRHWGPTSSRFDHHRCDPPADDPARGVMYVAVGPLAFATALAETFQDSDSQRMGPIDRWRRAPTITRFDTVDEMFLLDLDGGWITRAGGNQAIRTGSRQTTQRWARAIYEQHAGPLDLDGIAYGSSIWGPGRCVALWERAERKLPELPAATRALADPILDVAVANAALRLGAIVAP
jgi:hypothetical protein